MPSHRARDRSRGTRPVGAARAPPRRRTTKRCATDHHVGVTHNVAYAPALLPAPFGIVPGAVVYSVNLGLKYVPPVLEAPPTVYRYPNGDNGCSYHFDYPRQAEEDRQDYLGLITSFPTNWGDLGAPSVYHVNTDVRVSVLEPDGSEIGPGPVSLPVGTTG